MRGMEDLLADVILHPRFVEELLRRLKDIMGRGGGYIIEPGITIQDDVPLENILSMIEEARNYLR